MTLTTWSFSKKRNSTAQPTGAGRSYTVRLKENTSIERPVFIIGTGIDANINYCQTMGNYYFIDDIVLLTKDQVELHCSLDVLATHKTAIGAYTAYVERAASANDPYIIDSSVTASQEIVSENVTTTELFTPDLSGCYIVRTVSPGVSTTGVASWVMNENDISNLLDFITTTNNFQDVLTDSIVKTFFNPFQYILSIKWFPFAKNDIAGTNATLRLGWWDAGTYKRLTSKLYYDNVTVNKPTNYYSGDFRAYTQNFTRLIADIPSIGVMELDPQLLQGTIRCRVAIDWITGEMRLTFGREGTQGGLTTMTDGFNTISGQIGIDIPVGQINGMGGQFLAASDAGMGLLTTVGGAMVSAAADIIQGISNVVSPTKSVVGSTGNMASIISNPRLLLYIRNYDCGSDSNVTNGRPLCRTRVINTLSGYIKCAKASIALDAPATEIDEVNRLLNSGFYYE